VDNAPTIYHVERVNPAEPPRNPPAEVSARLTGGLDGSSSTRTTYFVNGDGAGMHGFSQEETDSCVPGVPYEEPVEAQENGASDGTDRYR
jgi:hypothetical protein